MKYFFAAVIGAGLVVCPLGAQAYTAQNGINVQASGSGFTVTGSDGFGARGVWCAAADYARVAAGAPTSKRLYVQGQSGNGRTVRFSLSPRGVTPTKVTSLGRSISTPGANLTIGHALGYCADRKLTTGSR